MLFLTAVWVPFSALSSVVRAVLSMGRIFTLPILFSALRGVISLFSFGTLGFITGAIDFLYPKALFAFTCASKAPGKILPSSGDRIDEELPNILQLFGSLGIIFLLSVSSYGCFSDSPYFLFCISNLPDPFGPVRGQIKKQQTKSVCCSEAMRGLFSCCFILCSTKMSMDGFQFNHANTQILFAPVIT